MRETNECPRKFKRRPSGRGSKKVAWRKLNEGGCDVVKTNHPETLVKRYVQQAVEQNSRYNTSQDEKNGSSNFFHLDAEGCAVAKKRLQPLIRHAEKNQTNLSQAHRYAISRVQKKLASHQRRLESQEAKKAGKEVYDIWSSLEETTEPPKKFHSESDLHLQKLPSVVLPHSGESINPDKKDYRNVVLSVVSRILEHEKQEGEFIRQQKPLSSELMDFLPEEVVNKLSFLEKQKVYHYAASIPESDSEKWSKVSSYISEKLPQEVKGLAHEEEYENQLIREEEDDEEQAQRIHRIMKKPKSASMRSRFRRNCRQLQEAARRREEKQFRHSINFIKHFLQEIKDKEDKKKVVQMYKKAVKEAYKAARREDFILRYKCGKYLFRDPERDILPPSVMLEQQGSLRKLKLSEVPGVALKDRVNSIYRRKLLEPLHANSFNHKNTRSFYRRHSKQGKAKRILVKLGTNVV